jgi:hypothetical protein
MSEESKEQNDAVSESGSTNDATSNTSSTPLKASDKKPGFKPVIIVVGLLIVLFGALQLGGVIDITQTQDNDQDDIAAGTDSDKVVARVNGEDIAQAELDERLAQVKRTVPEGTPDPTSDAGFQLQMLDEIINIKLLQQLAVNAGYTVSDDEVDAEIEEVKGLFGGEEQLNQQLDAIGLTQEVFRENVQNELLIRQLLDDNTSVDEIEITDEEIQDAYDQSFGTQEDAPAFDEVSGFIEEQLRQQAVNQEMQSYVDEVRNNADIEVLL